MKKYKIGDIITYKEGTDLNNELTSINIDKGMKFVKRSLEKDEKVFIDHRSDLPRTKFKKDFPDNPIVYDIDKADVIISCNSYIYGYGTYIDNIFRDNKKSWGHHVDEITIKKQGTADIFNKLISLKEIVSSDKPKILDTDLYYKGEIPRLMSDEEYKTIARLVRGDKEMLNLGMTMLLGFDHTINEEKYVLLLTQVRTPYYITKSRTYKSIIKILKQKYTNLR